MIAKRTDRKGKARFCPKVYNPRDRLKHGPGQILSYDDAKALGLPYPVPGTYATEKEARRVERRMQDAMDNWVPPEQRPITVAEWISKWLAEYPRKTETTNHHYRSMLKPLVAEYGDVALRDFTRTQARTFGLEHRAHVKVARVAWNDAIYEAEIPGVDRNPFDRLKLPPAFRKRDLALTTSELDELGACALHAGKWGPVLRAMIVFSAYTGLRFGELTAMEWSWFDPDRKTVEVRRQVDRFGVARATKTGEGDTPDAERPPLTISVPPQARAVLVDVPVSMSGYVFTLPSGGRLTHKGMQFYWRQIRGRFLGAPRDPKRQVELERLVWHSLRHSCSTLLIEAGATRWQAQMQMRHRNPGLVDSTYTHIERGKALERISELMASLASEGLGRKDGPAEAKNA